MKARLRYRSNGITVDHYWQDIIFSPEQQAKKPTISLTDFVLRIAEHCCN